MKRNWIRPLLLWIFFTVLLAINILPTGDINTLFLFLKVIVIGLGCALLIEFLIRKLFRSSAK